MTEEESQRLYARRERFVDCFIAASVADGDASLSSINADWLARRAIKVWNLVARDGREAMKDAGLLPFERVEK